MSCVPPDTMRLSPFWAAAFNSSTTASVSSSNQARENSSEGVPGAGTQDGGVRLLSGVHGLTNGNGFVMCT